MYPNSLRNLIEGFKLLPGIGEKTATSIIEKYHSIENAYAHVDEIKPPRASKNLSENYDMAVMSKKLATIEINAPVDFEIENGCISKVICIDEEGKKKSIATNHVILAIGHSARDTFEMLYQKNLEMSAKPFAVGVRIEHPQELINKSQYGDKYYNHKTSLL